MVSVKFAIQRLSDRLRPFTTPDTFQNQTADTDGNTNNHSLHLCFHLIHRHLLLIYDANSCRNGVYTIFHFHRSTGGTCTDNKKTESSPIVLSCPVFN